MNDEVRGWTFSWLDLHMENYQGLQHMHCTADPWRIGIALHSGAIWSAESEVVEILDKLEISHVGHKLPLNKSLWQGLSGRAKKLYSVIKHYY
jgi:hypothetical protein